MLEDKTKLKGITWNHSRGLVPMIATAQRFQELRPHVEIDWRTRTLQEFADKPVDKLTEAFDLLVIDHPWMGFVAEHEVFLKLDDYLSADFLQDQAENSVGQSWESYTFDGTQWAVPIDAAAPVAASRPDLLKSNKLFFPEKFKDVLELAKKGVVVFPGIPIDTLMHFYMFCSAYGEDPFETDWKVISEKVGLKALDALRVLAQKVDPVCFGWDPIKVYEAMTQEDRFLYCPFAYGYVNYAKKGYARNPLYFHDLVFFENSGRLKTTLGGTGLAISKRCENPELACEYSQFVTSPSCQTSLYFDSGGQPSRREGWQSDYINRLSSNFFKETLPALDRAFLRPRYDGYLFFQNNAGTPVREYMMNGGDPVFILNKLNQLYKKSLQ
jgi:multiple sugar transport system substrate-binding protein